MKKTFLAIILSCFLASSVMAVPYASQIRVGNTGLAPGAGTSITYFVNQAGGTATIQIVEEANPATVVATFNGTATKGVNTVTWDGTVNNAGGAALAVGKYRVKVTVAATAAAGWVEIASNSSVGNYVPAENPTIYQTLWDGCSPMESLISWNTDSDAFGYILTSTSYSAPRIDGHVVFNPDLSTVDGADGQSTWLNFPGTSSNNTGIWGNCFDPDDDEYVWVCGQSANTPVASVFYAKWNDVTLQNVTNGNTDVSLARDIAVAKQGTSKIAYVTKGNAAIWACDVTAGQIATTPAPINILGLTKTTLYSKGVDFDANGNLYYTSRYDTAFTSGADAVVYRWDAATVAAATAGSLTEANASWEVTFPTGATNGEGIAIDANGNVYAAIINEGALDPANDGSLRGIYLIGNVSQATNKKQLAVSDRVYAFYGTTTGLFSGYGLGIACDLAGNIIYTDRNTEMVRMIGPGGNTSVAILGPLSQTLEIASPPLAARMWEIYE